MAFQSLFIGIDKYQSPLIGDLSCAARDAKALHALFADSFGAEGSELLTDAAATRQAIITAIEGLQSADHDDVVIISFSGHGSDTHHLITHDCDPLALDQTAIHLDEFTELFARIPAANLILLLDCCFSGGAGAKVFHAPTATRSLESAEALLAKIGGRGRLIFTASTADQEALEDNRHGHGIFTFYLIEAFRGAPEIVKADRISILALTDFVTRSVMSAAQQMRHLQEPTLKGNIEGDLQFPVLKPGTSFIALFPQGRHVVASADIASLAQFSFPGALLDSLQASIPSLNQLQLDAINGCGLFDRQHLVVSAPTSSGKTMIGELAALHAHLRGERSYMLLPLRALVNDKYDEFATKYASYGLRVIRSTGEIADDDDALLRGKFDIALLTYERFASLLVTLPHIMRQVALVVVDEVQMITDKNRGANLEFILTLLKAQRFIGIEPQLIALSAVIGDTNGLENWLNARLLRTEARPVPLDEGVIGLDETYRYVAPDATQHAIAHYVQREYRKNSSQDIIIPLVRKLVADGEKIIVFRETKPIVQATANYLAQELGLPPADEAIVLLPSGDPSVASGLLRECLARGVAFHNADLDRQERHAVESIFRAGDSSLKVLVATTTLAMGVNTPAWSVIIAGLQHPDGPYTVAEYKNMVGRAGRLGFTPKGKSYLVAGTSSEAQQLWSNYVLARPESLQSRFGNLDAPSLLCRVLSTAAASRTSGLTAQELIDFIQSTFASHQHGNILTADEVKNTLTRLQQGGLAEQLEDRFLLTKLGSIAGDLGIRVESIVRVARALNGLDIRKISDRVLVAAAQVSVELDEVYFPVHVKSKKEQARWQQAMLEQRLPVSVQRELRTSDDPTFLKRCKRFAAVLMWIQGVELTAMEQSLLQHMAESNAAGPIRSTAERTRDLLGVVARIAQLVCRGGDMTTIATDELSARLEIGVPADVSWLVVIVKRQLDRGDYLSLTRIGLGSAEAIESAPEPVLERAVAAESKRRLVREAAKRQIEEMAAAAKLAMPAPPPD